VIAQQLGDATISVTTEWDLQEDTSHLNKDRAWLTPGERVFAHPGNFSHKLERGRIRRSATELNWHRQHLSQRGTTHGHRRQHDDIARRLGRITAFRSRDDQAPRFQNQVATGIWFTLASRSEPSREFSFTNLDSATEAAVGAVQYDSVTTPSH